MVSKKPDPYLIDEDNYPLTDEEIKGLMTAEEFYGRYGALQDDGGVRTSQGEGKQQVTLRLDRSILDHFKAGGPGWQTRLNAALAELVEKKQASDRSAA